MNRPTADDVRRTQQERSAAMRKRLLDATVDSLVEKGYRGTTTLEVQERAGVSRGALLHHYGSRSALMVAAVEHLLRERVAELRNVTAAPPPRSARIDWAVGMLWETFQGPLFTAALELWLAARNDSELLAALVPQERQLGRVIRQLAVELFGSAATAPEFDEGLEVLLDAMRGAAARGVLRSKRTDDRLLASWSRLMHDRLGA